ncbi:unnamed protein product [Triticum aestivum]|uniref:FBD domain-containing protein n=2 Tax=Triticum aestivum TaxID=4565 RepID=A0A9R1JE91_WHEAT|nr:putative FBD-associated F-box protein At5g56440 [Triticum aestivum]KAF7013672.1 hypothetical protein CFC21_027739 [Triticum aestivum]SPT16039.1 unnamed protein product [Triticum aestivum]
MEAEEGDRISLLPDCLLGNIVSLLPVKNAACTMVLSRRWRRIWPSVPLDLDLDGSNRNLGSDGHSILRILSSHGDGPIRRFHATVSAHKATSSWLQILFNQRIDDSLVLKFVPHAAHPPLPRDLLRFSANVLRHLELHCCCLDPQLGVTLPLHSLHYLHLSNVVIPETSLHSMIAGCLALRKLQLFRVHNLRRLVPCSRNLVEVYIRPHVPLEKVSFSGTPNLESIVLLYADIWRLCPDIFVKDALPPKVRKVALTLPMLHSPNFVITPKMSVSIITTLILNMKFSDGEELRKATNMLSLFPCLQVLQIWCLAFEWTDKHAFGQWQPAADTIMCLNEHLKYVELHGYYGTIGEVQFASFLMAGAKALRAMQILHGSKLRDERINTMKSLILKGGKASSEAQLSFAWRSDIPTVREDLDSYLRQVRII